MAIIKKTDKPKFALNDKVCLAYDPNGKYTINGFKYSTEKQCYLYSVIDLDSKFVYMNLPKEKLKRRKGE